MKQGVRWILLGTLVVLVGIQFVAVDRSNPAVEAEVAAPANVRAILRRACYDCHSNETVWPWYSQVAPFSWLVARDVRKGREKLNFSTWNRIPTQQQVKKRKESWKEVAEGKMPLWFYLGIHRDATLSAEDRDALRQWALSTASEPTGSTSSSSFLTPPPASNTLMLTARLQAEVLPSPNPRVQRTDPLSVRRR